MSSSRNIVALRSAEQSEPFVAADAEISEAIAREHVLRLGGIPRMNTFSKLYLALLGQFPWKYLPTIPVEMILLPTWAPFSIYKMSSWSRAMLIPLAIINHFKSTRTLPGDKQLHELYPIGTEQSDLRLPRSG